MGDSTDVSWVLRLYPSDPSSNLTLRLWQPDAAAATLSIVQKSGSDFIILGGCSGATSNESPLQLSVSGSAIPAELYSEASQVAEAADDSQTAPDGLYAVISRGTAADNETIDELSGRSYLVGPGQTQEGATLTIVQGAAFERMNTLTWTCMGPDVAAPGGFENVLGTKLVLVAGNRDSNPLDLRNVTVTRGSSSTVSYPLEETHGDAHVVQVPCHSLAGVSGSSASMTCNIQGVGSLTVPINTLAANATYSLDFPSWVTLTLDVEWAGVGNNLTLTRTAP